MKFIYKKSFPILVILCLFICPKFSKADLFPTPPIENDVATVNLSTMLEEERFKNKKWGFKWSDEVTEEAVKLKKMWWIEEEAV